MSLNKPRKKAITQIIIEPLDFPKYPNTKPNEENGITNQFNQPRNGINPMVIPIAENR